MDASLLVKKKSRDFFNKRQKDIIFLSIILVFSVLPFWDLSKPGIINSVDASFPLDPARAFFSKFQIWDKNVNFGSDVAIGHPDVIPYLLPLYILSNFLSLESLHRIWIIGLYFMGGASMYFFGKTFSPNQHREITGFVAALFFMYNPLQAQFLVHGISPFNFALYLFPLSLLIFIKKFPSIN